MRKNKIINFVMMITISLGMLTNLGRAIIKAQTIETGYQIKVEANNGYANLVGDVSQVPSGYTLTSIAPKDDTTKTQTPATFNQKITQAGTYEYVLSYTDQLSDETKTQDISVEVTQKDLEQGSTQTPNFFATVKTLDGQTEIDDSKRYTSGANVTITANFGLSTDNQEDFDNLIKNNGIYYALYQKTSTSSEYKLVVSGNDDSNGIQQDNYSLQIGDWDTTKKQFTVNVSLNNVSSDLNGASYKVVAFTLNNLQDAESQQFPETLTNDAIASQYPTVSYTRLVIVPTKEVEAEQEPQAIQTQTNGGCTDFSYSGYGVQGMIQSTADTQLWFNFYYGDDDLSTEYTTAKNNNEIYYAIYKQDGTDTETNNNNDYKLVWDSQSKISTDSRITVSELSSSINLNGNFWFSVTISKPTVADDQNSHYRAVAFTKTNGYDSNANLGVDSDGSVKIPKTLTATWTPTTIPAVTTSTIRVLEPVTLDKKYNNMTQLYPESETISTNRLAFNGTYLNLSLYIKTTPRLTETEINNNLQGMILKVESSDKAVNNIKVFYGRGTYQHQGASSTIEYTGNYTYEKVVGDGNGANKNITKYVGGYYADGINGSKSFPKSEGGITISELDNDPGTYRVDVKNLSDYGLGDTVNDVGLDYKWSNGAIFMLAVTSSADTEGIQVRSTTNDKKVISNPKQLQSVPMYSCQITLLASKELTVNMFSYPDKIIVSKRTDSSEVTSLDDDNNTISLVSLTTDDGKGNQTQVSPDDPSYTHDYHYGVLLGGTGLTTSATGTTMTLTQALTKKTMTLNILKYNNTQGKYEPLTNQSSGNEREDNINLGFLGVAGDGYPTTIKFSFQAIDKIDDSTNQDYTGKLTYTFSRYPNND